ncbi:6-pyruvoyl-tetrahydropterin synthase [Modicisalibacter ilicicola DSM 19980]|uniref:6-carboxy-5,6,7,8-tetrahydropterin synthase n=1 Tax=Modicisalibacter ilicicola DSM 19980 TaxID=1121942 RepID=A0A1M4Z1N7_9GAMM|nr:6-carboxytetrahydropterin synthase [Halomonas ilicicola]SHF11868.1 6-pyruvoyl-tetrahydropterin synthase [Halomonas ilicicola DSM 19980]
MTLFVNALTQLDVSLWCPRRGLIGASWQVDAQLDGEVGEDGMLFGFDEAKSWITSRLDTSPDHTLLVPTQAPKLTVQECSEGLCMRTTLPYDFEIRAPRQAFTLLPWSEIGIERLARHYSEALTRRPPPRVEAIRLKLREEQIDGAAYTYSHGLKRHPGNCQRIAHGHRSRLHIWCDGERSPLLETQWAQRLDDRYLVAAEDILDGDATSKEALTIGYRSTQGRFQLRLPRARCDVLPIPTSVEHIAAWLAEQVARDRGQGVRVQVFEGIGKGAIAEASP